MNDMHHDRKSEADASTGNLSPENLAAIGTGHITYIKALRSEDVARIFPQAPALQPGLDLFALLAADGTPILLTDSREAAVANAAEHDMVTVSVH